MWLFDDILKKPEHTGTVSDPLSGGSFGWSSTATQSGGQPPADDTPIIIQKSSEETVFGADSESIAIEKMNAPSIEPTIHAESDSSSIIVSDIPASPIIVSEAPASPMMPIEPMQAIPTPVAVEPIEAAPVAATPTIMEPAPAPIADIFSTPVVASTPIAVAPTPIIAEPVTVAASTSSGSIFDSIMAADPTPAPITESPAVTTTLEPTTLIATTPMTPDTLTHNFMTPREFLEKSIANIDVMLGNIDTRHSAKETEELWYKMEKLRFTELEKAAHTEKIIMDKERDHAISMRKMLEKEIEKDEDNKKHVTSVESTLSDIGSKHPIHRHHKEEHTEA